MHRRKFLGLAAATVSAWSLRKTNILADDGQASAWRTYEVTTSVKIPASSGVTRVWLPQPIAETPFQRVVKIAVTSPGGKTSVNHNAADALTILAAEFPAGIPAELTTVHSVKTRDWRVSLRSVSNGTARSQQAKEFLKPTAYVPTDGIVLEKASEITKGATTDIEKARAIYEWIVMDTYRDPKVRGCGTGNIRPMLETGDYGGKCADLNGLFVGLLKASGLPARDVYGVRLGPTTLDCKCLGTTSDHVEKSQHCRAEVFLSGIGWVPMDPADVRKAVLEESPGHLDLNDPKIVEVRKRLFGSWEMNWLAYNYAQDVTLPGSSFKPVPFLMYPQAETPDGRLDSLDPAAFQYIITSRQVDPVTALKTT